jgi:hypothetical protein
VCPDRLAEAIGVAFTMDEESMAAYREAAADLLDRYRPEAIVETLRELVLPVLLGTTREAR